MISLQESIKGSLEVGKNFYIEKTQEWLEKYVFPVNYNHDINWACKIKNGKVHIKDSIIIDFSEIQEIPDYVNFAKTDEYVYICAPKKDYPDLINNRECIDHPIDLKRLPSVVGRLIIHSNSVVHNLNVSFSNKCKIQSADFLTIVSDKDCIQFVNSKVNTNYNSDLIYCFNSYGSANLLRFICRMPKSGLTIDFSGGVLLNYKDGEEMLHSLFYDNNPEFVGHVGLSPREKEYNYRCFPNSIEYINKIMKRYLCCFSDSSNPIFAIPVRKDNVNCRVIIFKNSNSGNCWVYSLEKDTNIRTKNKVSTIDWYNV